MHSMYDNKKNIVSTINKQLPTTTSPLLTFLQRSENAEQIEINLKAGFFTAKDFLVSDDDLKAIWEMRFEKVFENLPVVYEHVEPLVRAIEEILLRSVFEFSEKTVPEIKKILEINIVPILTAYIMYFAANDLFDRKGNILPEIYTQLNNHSRDKILNNKKIIDIIFLNLQKNTPGALREIEREQLENKLKKVLLKAYTVFIYQHPRIVMLLNYIDLNPEAGKDEENLNNLFTDIVNAQIIHSVDHIINQAFMDDIIAHYNGYAHNEMDDPIASDFNQQIRFFKLKITSEELANAKNPAIHDLVIMNNSIITKNNRSDDPQRSFKNAMSSQWVFINFTPLKILLAAEPQNKTLKKRDSILTIKAPIPIFNKEISISFSPPLGDKSQKIDKNLIKEIIRDNFFPTEQDFDPIYKHFSCSWNDLMTNLIPLALRQGHVVNQEDVKSRYLINIRKDEKKQAIYVEVLWNKMSLSNHRIPGSIFVQYEFTPAGFKLITMEVSTLFLKNMILSDYRDRQVDLHKKTLRAAQQEEDVSFHIIFNHTRKAELEIQQVNDQIDLLKQLSYEQLFDGESTMNDAEKNQAIAKEEEFLKLGIQYFSKRKQDFMHSHSIVVKTGLLLLCLPAESPGVEKSIPSVCTMQSPRKFKSSPSRVFNHKNNNRKKHVSPRKSPTSQQVQKLFGGGSSSYKVYKNKEKNKHDIMIDNPNDNSTLSPTTNLNQKMIYTFEFNEEQEYQSPLKNKYATIHTTTRRSPSTVFGRGANALVGLFGGTGIEKRDSPIPRQFSTENSSVNINEVKKQKNTKKPEVKLKTEKFSF